MADQREQFSFVEYDVHVFCWQFAESAGAVFAAAESGKVCDTE
jgi:hypothetical protein